MADSSPAELTAEQHKALTIALGLPEGTYLTPPEECAFLAGIAHQRAEDAKDAARWRMYAKLMNDDPTLALLTVRLDEAIESQP